LMARRRAWISRDVSWWAAFPGARITNGYVLDASFRNYRYSVARLVFICKSTMDKNYVVRTSDGGAWGLR
jgi:hypothetical protein